MKLTVFYDGQYWVGVIEQQEQGKLKAARYIFGTEPKNEEILDFINKEMWRFVSGLSQEVAVKFSAAKKVSPKRIARKAASEVKRNGVSTYAQEALQLEYEKRKKERQDISKQQRETEKAHKWEMKLQKAKEKHRGH